MTRTVRWAVPLLLLILVTGARAQGLASAFEAIEDGRLRFEFPTRADVYGDGRSVHTGGHSSDSSWRCDCEPGPARVELRVRGGRLRDVEIRVGGRWTSLGEGDADLGAVGPAEAADFLLGLAARPDLGDGAGLVFAATISEGFDDWSRLLDLARGTDLDEDVREESVFWLGQAAAEEATRGLIQLVDDDDEDLELREHAVFALSQRETDVVIPALTRIARENPHPQLRESAFFWLAQHDDPRVVAFFEEVLLAKD